MGKTRASVKSRGRRSKPAPKPSGAKSYERFAGVALKLGALAAKVVSPRDVETGHWVRWKCQFGCGGFGSSLVCPPHSPIPSETRKMLDEYSAGILFQSSGNDTKRIAVALEREVFLAGYYKAFGLGSGPCELCETCAMEQGCRHADEARPAMEACGIDVFATARKYGFTINVVRNYDEPQHYYGLVLIE